MEFVSPSVAKVRRSLIPGTPRRYLKVKTTEDANHNLSLYTHAVGETITLLEFQELGQARLKVLKEIESLKERFGSARDQYRKEYLKGVLFVTWNKSLLSNQFDRTCARYFEYTHKMPEGGVDSVITHPNECYSLSRKIGWRAGSGCWPQDPEIGVRNARGWKIGSMRNRKISPGSPGRLL